jgi:TRAP-type C4-dicarboxylate transport system substrate-binding protein
MVEALGGNATPMAYGEVYQGLVQGVIDGAENNFPSYESSRHFEVAKVYSLTRHVMAPEILAISRYRWEKLTPSDRDHVRAAAQLSVPVMRRLWDDQVQASRRLLEESNVRIIEPSDHDAFIRKVEPVWDQYLISPALRRLAEDIFNTGDAW